MCMQMNGSVCMILVSLYLFTIYLESKYLYIYTAKKDSMWSFFQFIYSICAFNIYLRLLAVHDVTKCKVCGVCDVI